MMLLASFSLLFLFLARRSASSLQRASISARCLGDADASTSLSKTENIERQRNPLWFPFGDWLSHPWSKQHRIPTASSDLRKSGTGGREPQQSPFLPKITMVGISTGEAGQVSKASLKKTMENLTRDLEQGNDGGKCDDTEERDPLFVANVGDYYSGLSKAGSGRWTRRGNDRQTPS